jgi:hypothetical protein
LNGALLTFQKAEGDATGNPTDGGQCFDSREVGFGIGEVMKGKRVTQSKGGDIKRAISDEGWVKAAESDKFVC